MAYILEFGIVILIVLSFFIYNTYSFQFFIHRIKVKKTFLNDFRKSTRGRFIDEAYFGPSHKIISKREFNSFTNKQKINFSKCYNVITFKTADVEWELFFNIIKEGLSFTEVLNLRAFPINATIKSEGNIERNYSRVNVFTNNHYLTNVLEVGVNNDVLWLMRYDGDMLLISGNNLHFKAFVNSKKISLNRAMDMIRALDGIKKGIYKKDIIEY